MTDPPVSDDAPCKGIRWSIKSAADRNADAIQLSSKTETTISQLRSINAPIVTETTNRIAPVETTVYRISNVVLEYARQMPDEDYHLVIADEKGRGMIVESTDPQCSGASVAASQIKSVRSKITGEIQHISNAPVYPKTVVTVTGVGFFDEFSGAFGQAPNAIELHPLTSICFGLNCKP